MKTFTLDKLLSDECIADIVNKNPILSSLDRETIATIVPHLMGDLRIVVLESGSRAFQQLYHLNIKFNKPVSFGSFDFYTGRWVYYYLDVPVLLEKDVDEDDEQRKNTRRRR